MARPVTLPIGSLPNIGVLSYGGVRFEELLKSKITGHPEWDRAKRVVKYVKYTLEVDGFIISENNVPIDPLWSRIRYILQKPGLALTYSQRGFSNFNVNNARGGLVDVCNGPHPEILGFTPIGNRLAAHIIWKCEICLPEITPARDIDPLVPQTTGFQTPFSRGILSFNWTTDLHFQRDGYATYSVEGELEIARINGRQDNLENYRAYTEPQIPPGFKPEQRSFKIDDAKRQIKFKYDFSELPVMGIPIRCTGATGSYRVSNENKMNLVKWTANLQASYTVVPTGPRREAWMRFLGLMTDRMRASRRGYVPNVNGIVQPRNLVFLEGNGLPVPPLSGPNLRQIPNIPPHPEVHDRSLDPIVQTFSVNEGLYEDSKSVSFECSWTLVCRYEEIFSAFGIWRRMGDCAGQFAPNSRRDIWVTDMASIQGFTSWYDYGFSPDTEIIITADGNSRQPMTRREKSMQTGPTADESHRVSRGAELRREGVDPDSGQSPDESVRMQGLPSPEASWLNYEIDFITELDPGIALHKALPQSNDLTDTLASVDVFGAKSESHTTYGVNTVSKSTGSDVLQRMATSTYRVALRGFGVRLGYKVPVPGLLSFGGSAVSPAKQVVIGPRIVANYSGVPVYLTAWLLWYDVPAPPRQQQTAPPNLAAHIGDISSPPRTIGVPISESEAPAINKSSLLSQRRIMGNEQQ